jgi:hypothetical protein
MTTKRPSRSCLARIRRLAVSFKPTVFLLSTVWFLIQAAWRDRRQQPCATSTKPVNTTATPTHVNGRKKNNPTTKFVLYFSTIFIAPLALFIVIELLYQIVELVQRIAYWRTSTLSGSSRSRLHCSRLSVFLSCCGLYGNVMQSRMEYRPP